jgi:hypothetical protein
MKYKIIQLFVKLTNLFQSKIVTTKVNMIIFFLFFYYGCDSHATKDFTRFHWIIHDHVIHELYCRVKPGIIFNKVQFSSHVLEPALWNVMYDAVLRIELPVGARTIAFADDLALVTMSRKEEELMHITNEALKKIQEWMERAGLKLASQKTESVLLVGQRRPGEVSLCLGGETIVPTTCIKYLGVWVDRGMTFRPHILRTSEKPEKIVAMLGRLMPNVGGASSAKRKILGTVAYSTLLYASNVWAEALQRKNNTNALMRVQRRITLRVVSAYRTVSTEALQVLASSVPIDPMVEGRTNILEGKQAKSENTRRIRQKWQERWSNSTKGGWIRKLIPQIEPWLIDERITTKIVHQPNLRVELNE